ncbi:MAG: CAP domain-containing protein [Polyangiales bacterium]
MRSVLLACVIALTSSGCLADGAIEGLPTDEGDSGSHASHDSGTLAPDDDSSAPPDEDASVPTEDAPSIPESDSSMPPPTDTAVTDTYVPPKDTAVMDTYVPPPPMDAATGWPADYAALEQGILEETNKRRAAGADCHTQGKFGPAGPLVMQSQLQSSARKHSEDMAEHNYFSHTDLSGGSPFDRMKAEGYTGGFMGENIAAGNATVAATMDQWMNSDGHCANIMNPKYTDLGVGYFYYAGSTYKHYWTQNFGAH